MIRKIRVGIIAACLVAAVGIGIFIQYKKPTSHITFAKAKADLLLETTERFHPVTTRNAIIATQNTYATEVGLEILKKGGNAIDASVAIAYTLAVTLPYAGNIGGGGFMLYWDNKKQRAYFIDYRETAPAQASKDMFLNKDGSINKYLLTNSYLSSAVPGTVAGLSLALEKFGSMPLKELLQPAIKFAQDGVPVSLISSTYLEAIKDRLQTNAASRAIFMPNNHLLKFGEALIQADLAKTLQRIANNGPQEFYSGQTAQMIVADMQKYGGIISLADLKNYRAQIMEPVRGTYRGYTIFSAPPPSSGGITLIEMLNILENYHFNPDTQNSAQNLHLLIETMNLAYNDRNNYLGDPKFVTIPQKLLQKDYAKQLFDTINFAYHTPATNISKVEYTPPEGTNTTHFTVIDKDGNIVSNTYTLNSAYGNALVVNGAGFLMNNEMADFNIKAGSKNLYGLIEGDNNQIAPNKQPLSSMTPTILLNQKSGSLLSLGTPGGSRIITNILQNIVNIIDFNKNIATACALPKIHSQLWPDSTLFEDGISIDTLEILHNKGHELIQGKALGSLQAAEIANDYYFAYSDPRKPDSLAAGY